jgi:hypothetical protein
MYVKNRIIFSGEKIRSRWQHSGIRPMEKGLIPIGGEMIKDCPKRYSFRQRLFYLKRIKLLLLIFYRKRIFMKSKDKEKPEAQINILRIIYERLLDSGNKP